MFVGKESTSPTTLGSSCRRKFAPEAVRFFATLICCAATLLALASPSFALSLGVAFTSEPANVPEMPLVHASGAQTFRVPAQLVNDSLAEAAAQSNVTLLALIGGGESLPSNRPAFLAEVTEKVKRYGVNGSFWSEHPSLPSKPITTWEVWNEPNLKHIKPAEFGTFMNEVAEKIHKESLGGTPEVLFGGILANGNLGPTSGTWAKMDAEGKGTTLRGALKYLEEAYGSLGAYVDGIAIHPYELNEASFFTPEGGSRYNRIEAFKYAVGAFHSKLVELAKGGSQKSLSITETGWPADDPEIAGKPELSVSPEEQATLVGQVVSYGNSNQTTLNLKNLDWYNFRDAGTPNPEWALFCGLRAGNGNFRPSWTAFQAAAGVAQFIPQAPAVETGAAGKIGSFEATLTGVVNPHGLPTNYKFEWGLSTSYGSSSTSLGIGSGESALSFEETIGQLAPNTTYHFRVVASNSVGASYGTDRTFTTSTAVPFSDSTTGNSITNWFQGITTTSGWQQAPLFGHAVAKGTKPATLIVNGTPHIFFVDATNGNTITDWTYTPTGGWQQTQLFGHQVAAGTSPSAVLINGTPHVFFVDALNNNSITDWTYTPAGGWQQTFFYGHRVATGTSPSATEVGGVPNVFFVDATNNNTITDWWYTVSSGWQQAFFYGHTVAAGTSPTAVVAGGVLHAFFVDATNGNTITDWSTASGSWQQNFFYGHTVAPGTSPAAAVLGTTPNVFFVDAANNNTITDWRLGGGWSQIQFFGHEVAAGTSPAVTTVGGALEVFFVDATNSKTISRWSTAATGYWQQDFFYGHQVASETSPGVAVINGYAQPFFSDSTTNNSVTNWFQGTTTTEGWQQAPLFGHAVAKGTKPATLVVNGTPHVFFVDATNGNTITDWSFTPNSGWQQSQLFGHQVAAGTSPTAVNVNGTPHVFFVDASNGNTITDWSTASGSWQQNFFYGHTVTAGTSPSATVVNGTPHVFFVDAANNKTITDWTINGGWTQVQLYGHQVAAGSSPSAANVNGVPHAFFVDATNGNTITDWSTSSGSWQQNFFYGHTVATGSSPSATAVNGTPHVFFVDATNNKSITDWTINGGWTQVQLFGHEVAAGTSPAATTVGTAIEVFFVDATNGKTITRWSTASGSWQQAFFYGHQVASETSPAAF
jgi:hypothetical protein